jgi:hypothetical protein
MGSTSGRSKIFEAQDPGKLPLIPAHLTHHIQDGGRCPFPLQDLLEELGTTIVVSSGMPAPAGRSPAACAGRADSSHGTEKDQSDLVQRSSFRSLLTGERNDYGSHGLNKGCSLHSSKRSPLGWRLISLTDAWQKVRQTVSAKIQILLMVEGCQRGD